MSASKSIQIILARQLASSLAMPILLVDTEGTLIYYNEPAEVILDQRFDETGEMPGAEWPRRFALADEERKPIAAEDRPMRRALSERRPISRVVWMRCGNREWRHVHITAFPLIGEEAAPRRDDDLLGRLRCRSRSGARAARSRRPTPDMARYGGNTSCVASWARRHGAGAGCGDRHSPPGQVDRRAVRRIDILLTHLHMDHIQGLGFFAPLYAPTWRCTSGARSARSLRRTPHALPLAAALPGEHPDCRADLVHDIPSGDSRSASSG